MNIRLLAQELGSGPISFLKIRIQKDAAYIPKKIILCFIVLVLMPFSFVMYFFKWRYCNIYCDRIGHQIAEYFYVSSIFGKYKPFTIYSESAANEYLYLYYKNIKVLTIKSICKLFVESLYIWPWLTIDVENAIRSDKFKIYQIKNKNHNKFTLIEQHKDAQLVLLEKLNINLHNYICIHVRSRGFSPDDDDRFEYRNSTFKNFEKIIDYCKIKGLDVVIVGDENNYDNQYVINYPNSIYKSKINDLLLISGAKYFIGNSSGLHLVAWAFGVKVLLLNMTPYNSTPYFSDIKFIRKNLIFNKEMTTQEIEALDKAFHSNIFRSLKTDLMENTEIQILKFIKKIII